MSKQENERGRGGSFVRTWRGTREMKTRSVRQIYRQSIHACRYGRRASPVELTVRFTCNITQNIILQVRRDMFSYFYPSVASCAPLVSKQKQNKILSALRFPPRRRRVKDLPGNETRTADDSTHAKQSMSEYLWSSMPQL